MLKSVEYIGPAQNKGRGWSRARAALGLDRAGNRLIFWIDSVYIYNVCVYTYRLQLERGLFSYFF